MSLSVPKFILNAFAKSGLKNTIPESADPVTGDAGYTEGFPAITMQQKTAGGIPPKGQDFNGVLFDITSAIQYAQSGQEFPFNQSFANSIGGYAKGAVVSDPADRSIVYKSKIDANLVAPPSAGWEVQGVVSSASVVGIYSNLKMSASGLSAATLVSCDELVVASAAKDYKTLYAVSLTPSTATTGVNGIDTGVSAVNTWYSVWVIYNGTTTSGLLSLSATSPALPAGYTHKARVGWIRTDGAANKYPLSFVQSGRVAQYLAAAGTNVPALPVMASGAAGALATTLTPVTTSAFAPVTAGRIKISVYNFNNSSVQLAPVNVPAIPGGGGMLVGDNAIQNCMQYESALIGSTVFYAANGATSISCIGWEDNL